ncbi:hypothetical protein EIP91_006199 [Steccherinum ochraceum]|uniref:Uncharacterized protein n=1 Tax=Steccherinum ochraceum TaxID=92696 RepID=A0A4R0R8K9_9APHY|nr:hypothetical protein EIP91_006199 [Steccherinum ochraceum]
MHASGTTTARYFAFQAHLGAASFDSIEYCAVTRFCEMPAVMLMHVLHHPARFTKAAETEPQLKPSARSVASKKESHDVRANSHLFHSSVERLWNVLDAGTAPLLLHMESNGYWNGACRAIIAEQLAMVRILTASGSCAEVQKLS